MYVRYRLVLVISVISASLLVAVGCGSDDVIEGAPSTETPNSSVAAEPARQPLRPTFPVSECCNQAAIAGGFELAGDPATGCVWLQALDTDADMRVSTMWPDGFTVSFDPLRVYDRQGHLFAEAGVRYGLGGSRRERPAGSVPPGSLPVAGYVACRRTSRREPIVLGGASLVLIRRFVPATSASQRAIRPDGRAGRWGNRAPGRS